jgi:hypothetical protein
VKYTQTAGIYRRRLTTRYWPVSSVLGYRHAPDSSAASKCSVRLYSGRRRLDHDWPSSALATVIPVTGWAADRFGTKALFITSVLAFTLGSLPCNQAPIMLLLTLFRVLQVERRHVAAVGNDDLDARGGAEAAGPLDGGARHTGSGPGGEPILGGWLIGSCEPKSNLANGGIGAWCGWWRPRSTSRHFCPRDPRSSPQRLQPTGHGFSKPAPAPEIDSIC